ncbi:Tol-Pal system beta propeller repeat protein TolB [Anaeromyxobacter paludicola]|uniref:Protein TolB n=1 Tax=Anaeromyxobacter paludicola TaxID=2918171 RepID=A0ABN6N775_9BACT|nr:Tol-Pal system beta propeller repeat protein TolB [Anaeromyxobacter paludicola]BDG09011.1 protein TolB [Anaeromyxobacter paludicola]
MTRLSLLLALLPAVALAQPPQQRPHIEIDRPDFKPLPLAVAPFKADTDALAAATEVNATLRGDLGLTGLFELLDPRSFLADPSEGLTAPSIRFQRWIDVGADGLVKGAVRAAGGQVSGELHLFEVRGGREGLSVTRTAPGPRALAHLLADEIVRYYTGEPGVFGTRIAAIRKVKGARELVLFDVDGKDPQVLLRDPSLAMLPAWRPDGRALLFTSYRGGKPELWTVDVSTRAVKRVASVGELATGGAFSPDGRLLAFAASEAGNSDIWVANADGSNPRRLTHDPATDTSPTWSPDGRRIAFVSTRAGNPHLYVMNADGSGQRRLTFKGTYNQTPRWSPRGDLIAFTGRDERKVFDVFLVNPDDGNDIRRVTQDQGFTNEEPTWAPSGRMLAFTSDRNGRPQLVISTADGNHQKVVTADPGELQTPAWGPLP